MFKQSDQADSAGYSFAESGHGSGGEATLSLADAITTPLRAPTGTPGLLERLAEIDWVPDLGQNIGSREWFRGLATLTALSAASLIFLPGFTALPAAPDSGVTPQEIEEFRTNAIMPLAYGADTGRRMAATDAVLALTESPERPTLNLSATIGRGDSFERVLQRAGVGGKQADRLAALVGGVIPLSDIKPGTRLDILLGRRESRKQARPLDSIAFRARFDLNLEIDRVGSDFAVRRNYITVDDTPLRIRGSVGSSLYRSARAAGAPPKAIQAYLKTLSSQLSLGNDIRATDAFDIIVDYKRAETGEVEVGDLLYAGLERGGKPKAQMLRWDSAGRSQWFEASGVGEQRGEMARPVPGAISSGFGSRRHPILGYRRMHNGLDFRARRGEPIHAAADGVVSFAGRNGGYGNFVKLKHDGNLSSGYAHMSRIAVSSGRLVSRGQIIGYVGSTGLSTGPHLHYELYRGGRPVNPNSVRFTTRAKLGGSELRRFKAQLAELQEVTPGAALEDIVPAAATAEPEREIDRLAKAR